MIRKAILDDVPAIHALLQFYNVKSELLARPLSKLYDHLRDFWIFENSHPKKVVGCCALQFCNELPIKV
jgi:amino-acid N-acetyltransferase